MGKTLSSREAQRREQLTENIQSVMEEYGFDDPPDEPQLDRLVLDFVELIGRTEGLEKELSRSTERRRITRVGCDIQGCGSYAVWSGWTRVRDQLGVPTGLLQRADVCENKAHSKILVDKEEA